MHTTQNSLSCETRAQVAAILHQIARRLDGPLFANKAGALNVRGRLFYSLHTLFDELAASTRSS